MTLWREIADMHKSLVWAWMAGMAACLGFLGSTPAVAQTNWESLESRIRQQTQQGKQLDVPPKPAATPGNGPGTAAPVAGQAEVVAAPPGTKPYLGILADDRNDRGQGVRVLKIFPGGPGEKAGLQEQDLITAIAEVRVRQMGELADILELYSPGDKVTLEFVRNGQTKRADLTFAQRPRSETLAPGSAPAISSKAVPLPAVPPPPQPGPEIVPSTPPAVAAPRTETAKEPPPLILPKPPVDRPPQIPEEVPSEPLRVASTPPVDDRSRMLVLEQRVAELERRVAELERRLEKHEP
jgi:hypothetical protein